MKEMQRHQQGEEWEKCPKLLGNESTGVLGTGRDAGDISRGLGQPGAWGCGGGEGKETHCRQLTHIPKKQSCRQGMMMTVRVRGRQRRQDAGLDWDSQWGQGSGGRGISIDKVQGASPSTGLGIQSQKNATGTVSELALLMPLQAPSPAALSPLPSRQHCQAGHPSPPLSVRAAPVTSSFTYGLTVPCHISHLPWM